MNRPSEITPRARLLAVGGVAAVILAGGGAAAWAAADPTSTPSTGSGAPADPAPKAHTPHLSGTVVSADGSTIVITDRDGFARTINVTAATTYDDGLTSTPAAGTEIHAEGTVNADGVSLDATTVGAQPQMPTGGPGGAGERGGPRGEAPTDAPAPPTDAPSGAPTPAPSAS